MKRYNPKDIEPKWQQQWKSDNLYSAVDFDKSRPKYVMLTEFPYPSGDGLHIGHIREYTLGDVIARHKRMTGHNVLYPMGYDAFGLPAENYAIKHKVTPQQATDKNIGNFQQQFDSLGFSFDWSRSFRTTDPSYYKWTQWLFLQFYKASLAYQDKIAINWCPKCKTGLANEEVINGKHERCDTVVEKRILKQWVLKITKYADRLIDGLADLDYPSRIADQQVNWIGRSKGAEVSFDVQDTDRQIKVFTTRADTLFGATFLVLAPEHPLIDIITTKSQKSLIDSYVKASQAKSDIERQDTSRDKTGVFTGAYAINPANNKKVPVWIADYVLFSYGTGAIMAVPAHDERDYQFAKKFDLPIIEIVSSPKQIDSCYSGEGELINSGGYSGQNSAEARDKIIADLSKNNQAKEKINYKLRDWIFSRQHYWGEPIPVIHCDKDGAVPVPDSQLPVVLPKVDFYEPTETGESPLAKIEEWVNVDCPVCGGPAKRETDTMPNWAGSSWYYLRYYDPHNDTAFAGREKLDYWGEVDMYLGGMEHTTLHLLYSRFWHQFLYDKGLVPTPEPYKARRGQGIILATDGSKMSKSKGNVVNPNHILEQGYGADSLRLAIAFLAPFDQSTLWNPESLGGTFRFLQRIWTLVHEHEVAEKHDSTDGQDELNRTIHQAIKSVSSDLENLGFNTAIASLMETLNSLYKLKLRFPLGSEQWTLVLVDFIKLLAPFAPHIAEELWVKFDQDSSVHVSSWPVHNPKLLQTEEVKIIIQVNGKLKGEIIVSKDTTQSDIEAKAKSEPKVIDFLKDKNIVKTIYVPGRIINIVAN